ncbi:pentapeptide repeat-containing protein [Cyanobacteria bacterium FACHB-63]|nr:pentapeptide repeat-containing protein [Cyanobacteria bacterium FACHB-63]
MRRNQIWTIIGRVALGLLAATLLGGYWHIQRQNVSDLQRQIAHLPDGKDKVTLVKDRITLDNATYGNLVQAVGGLLLFVTAWVSFENLKATQRNVLVAEEKQVTERFTQAINQLGTEGDDKIAVRLGETYALGRIAEDSPRDYWTIMEILTSFIREKVWLLKAEKPGSQQVSIVQDVQAALTVIGRPAIQKLDDKRNLDDKYLRLRDLNLSHALLAKADLSRAMLYGSILFKANLIGANLSQAILVETNLGDAFLMNAILRHTNLSSSNLGNAKLMGSDLREADLSNANLKGADLSEAKLGKVKMNGADLYKANLTDAQGLTPEQIRTANNWRKAQYSGNLRRQLGLPCQQEP